MLAADQQRPICGRCGAILSLLIQLDLVRLPENNLPWQAGLFQLFYCPSMEDEKGNFCDDFEAFSECHKLQVIESNASLVATEAGPFDFPAKDIIEWKPFVDLPGAMEQDLLGLRFDYDFKPNETHVSVHWDEANLHFLDIVDENDNLAELISSAQEGDKYLGWPNWVQGVEYPNCPECGEEMHYFLQIDSENGVDHMFGDVGCGHVSYCPNHPDQIAFTWACG